MFIVHYKIKRPNLSFTFRSREAIIKTTKILGLSGLLLYLYFIMIKILYRQ